MRLYVGITDWDWYDIHAQRPTDEVNFWRPKGEQGFSAVQEGEPFLFKLHFPHNFVVGGGFFASHTKLSISMAWRIYGEKNGFSDIRNSGRKSYRSGENQIYPLLTLRLAVQFSSPRFFFRRSSGFHSHGTGAPAFKLAKHMMPTQGSERKSIMRYLTGWGRFRPFLI